MIWLVARKLIQGLTMVLTVSILTFASLSAAGGNAFSALRENPQVSKQTIENLGRVYGVDRPFAERYIGWLADVVRGNLGESFYFHLPVLTLIWPRLLNTMLLGAVALLIASGMALVLSILSARFRTKSLNTLIHGIVLVTASTPRIVLALIALAVSLWLSVPVLGSGTNSVASLLLGAIALAAPLVALFLTQTYEGLSQAMREDFIQLARAKGLDEWTLIFRHALRAALNPVLTIFGLSLGALLSGSVIVETVLNRPGIGELMVTGVRNRDIPLIMAVVLFSSLAIWLGNFVGEILQLINDKRLRSNQET
jgi:peptide/nickel transport system permease protein